MSKPLIIAHRGASVDAPENTLAAFEAALDAGADGVEFDVQLAADGVPVVIHDETLKRTGRLPKRVADLTSGQLGETDVGSWFNAKFPHRARSGFSNETVPTLERSLRMLTDFRGLIYVELKCDQSNYGPLAEGVCDQLRDSPLLERIVISSFTLPAIAEIRRLLPAVETAALFQPSISTILNRSLRVITAAEKHGAAQLSLHYSLATPKLCSMAGEAALPVTVWTVDHIKWLDHALNRDIRALITNDPAKLIARRREVSG